MDLYALLVLVSVAAFGPHLHAGDGVLAGLGLVLGIRVGLVGVGVVDLIDGGDEWLLLDGGLLAPLVILLVLD